MGEYTIEFLQVPARLMSHALEGLVQSPGTSLLVLSAMLLLVLTALPGLGVADPGEAGLALPPSDGEACGDAALAKVLDHSRGDAAAVLGVSTPGGGE